MILPAKLSTLPNLKTLVLADYTENATSGSLLKVLLRSCTQLHTLQLDLRVVPPGRMSDMQMCSSLRRVEISQDTGIYGSSADSWKTLNDLKHLTQLTALESDVGHHLDLAISDLADLTDLHALRLWMRDLEDVQHTSALTKLTLLGVDVKDFQQGSRDNLQCLGLLTDLKHVFLGEHILHSPRIIQQSWVTQLTTLELELLGYPDTSYPNIKPWGKNPQDQLSLPLLRVLRLVGNSSNVPLVFVHHLVHAACNLQELGTRSIWFHFTNQGVTDLGGPREVGTLVKQVCLRLVSLESFYSQKGYNWMYFKFEPGWAEVSSALAAVCQGLQPLSQMPKVGLALSTVPVTAQLMKDLSDYLPNLFSLDLYSCRTDLMSGAVMQHMIGLKDVKDLALCALPLAQGCMDILASMHLTHLSCFALPESLGLPPWQPGWTPRMPDLQALDMPIKALADWHYILHTAPNLKRFFSAVTQLHILVNAEGPFSYEELLQQMVEVGQKAGQSE